MSNKLNAPTQYSPTKKKSILWIGLGIAAVAAGFLAWYLTRPAPEPVATPAVVEPTPAPIPSFTLTPPAPIKEVQPEPVQEYRPQNPPVQPNPIEKAEIIEPTPKEDSVVRPLFFKDLAKWLVAGYVPTSSTQGKISVDFQEANMRYGMRMRGLSYSGKNVSSGRSSVLKYIFTPSVMNGLYKIYIDRFMENVASNVDKAQYKGKPWTKELRSDMYAQYAERFSVLSNVLKGISLLSVDELSKQVQNLHTLGNNVVAAEKNYSESVFAHEQSIEKQDTALTAQLQKQVRTAANQYKKSVMAREKARRVFANMIKSNDSARNVSDSDAIFVAQWVERRATSGINTQQTISTAANILRELSQKFSAVASK